MHHTLRTVDHHHHAAGMGNLNGTRQIRAAAGDVGHLPQRQNTAARRNQLRQTRHVRQEVRTQRELYNLCPGLFGHHQPGYQVGVVFRLADDDLIPGLQQRTRVTLRHHVNGLGGAPRPDDVLTAVSIDQARDLIPCGFVLRR